MNAILPLNYSRMMFLPIVRCRKLWDVNANAFMNEYACLVTRSFIKVTKKPRHSTRLLLVAPDSRYFKRIIFRVWLKYFEGSETDVASRR